MLVRAVTPLHVTASVPVPGRVQSPIAVARVLGWILFQSDALTTQQLFGTLRCLASEALHWSAWIDNLRRIHADEPDGVHLAACRPDFDGVTVDDVDHVIQRCTRGSW